MLSCLFVLRRRKGALTEEPPEPLDVSSRGVGRMSGGRRGLRRGHALGLVLALAVAVALSACGTADVGSPITEDGAVPGTPADDEAPVDAAPSPDSVGFGLRGDPGFMVGRLEGEQRALYERFLDEINDPDNLRRVMASAGRDDLFEYGRVLHPYMESVLTTFRMTGDLALLDYVDVIAERMRDELQDRWRGTLDGTDGTRDGFLNWVYRYSDSSTRQFVGKDTIQLDEIRTHAFIAQVAYALDRNRDLESPSGRDYGAHADFWRDYLVHHFEAKWRERKDVPVGFPFMGRPGVITYYAWAKWHYYMWRLTGDDGYGVEAHRMADNLWSHMRPVETPSGTAYVWSRRVIDPVMATDRESPVLAPSSYSLSVISHAIDFHFEGFHRWAADEEMRSFARMFTEFMIDTDDPVRNGFAPDIGGGVPRAGLVPPDWSRLNHTIFMRGGYSFLGHWDRTDRIVELVDAIQRKNSSSNTSALAASLFVHAWLHPTEGTTMVDGGI